MDCKASNGGFPQDISPPPGIVVTFTLPRTTYKQGKPERYGPPVGDPSNIVGEVVIENRSEQTTRWWEGVWPSGLALGNRFVGGYCNTCTRSAGYAGHPFHPGDVKRFPVAVDTLQCSLTSDGVRQPVPPGTYDVIVSVPIGDKLIIPDYKGVIRRVRINIVKA